MAFELMATGMTSWEVFRIGLVLGIISGILITLGAVGALIDNIKH